MPTPHPGRTPRRNNSYGVLRVNFHPLGIREESNFLPANLTKSMRKLERRKGILHVIMHIQGLQHSNRDQRLRLLSHLDQCIHREPYDVEYYIEHLAANEQLQDVLSSELRMWFSLHLRSFSNL
jgi:hypothetical protein